MQWVISILTMVAFAVHAVMGCCIHHLHPDGKTEASFVTEQQSLESHACCRHFSNFGPLANSSNDGGPEQPTQSAPCEDVACSFPLEPSFRISEFFPQVTSLFDSPGIDGSGWSRSMSAPQMTVAADCPPWYDSQTVRASLQCWIV